MSVHIELTDQQAEALKAKAAAQGVTLHAWLEQLAGLETDAPATAKPLISGYGMLAQYGPGPSAEEIDENRREMFRNFAKDF